jgi:hypothetical protein
MSHHYAFLTIDWAKRKLDYKGLVGQEYVDIFDPEDVLALFKEHEENPKPDTQVWAIAFMDTGCVVDDKGDVYATKQMEFYSAQGFAAAVWPLSFEDCTTVDQILKKSRSCWRCGADDVCPPHQPCIVYLDTTLSEALMAAPEPPESGSMDEAIALFASPEEHHCPGGDCEEIDTAG